MSQTEPWYLAVARTGKLASGASNGYMEVRDGIKCVHGAVRNLLV